MATMQRPNYTAQVNRDPELARCLVEFRIGIVADSLEKLREHYKSWKSMLDGMLEYSPDTEQQQAARERAINLIGAYLEAIEEVGKARRGGSPEPLRPQLGICARHGNTIDEETRSCWECDMERDIQRRERQEDIDVAQYKARRDEQLIHAGAARQVTLDDEPQESEMHVPAGYCRRHLEPLFKDGSGQCWECRLPEGDQGRYENAIQPTHWTERQVEPNADLMDPAEYANSRAARADAYAEEQAERAEEKKQDVELDAISAGRYALPAQNGHVVFYKVDRPNRGRWNGYVFVKQLFGSPQDWRQEDVRGGAGIAVLRRIAEFGVAESMALFGEKARRCGKCHSPLSNVRSRAAGYGEKCADNLGLPYPSESEARAQLQERGIDPDAEWDDDLFSDTL